MKIAAIFLLAVSSLFNTAYGSERQSSGESTNLTVAANDSQIAASQNPQSKGPSNAAAIKPTPRLLPLQLIAPPAVKAGTPFVGVSVNLSNPGDAAPNSMLRLIVHEKGLAGGRHGLSSANVKVEVLENGAWVPVLLSMVEGNVMGAIGPEGVTAHSERYKPGGFQIPAGLNKTWQLRLTINLPGTYTLVAAVSPDSGSTHLAQPAHVVIVVQ